MKLFRQLRRVYQVIFLALFLFLIVVTTAKWIGGYPVEWFLGLDPLVALSTGLAGGGLHSSLAWAIILTVLTLVFGRFFCGWICPMGVLHHFIGWLGRPRGKGTGKARMAQNVPRGLYKTKYVILVFMLGASLLGSTQVGLLDPIAFSWRALATVIFPALGNATFGLYQGERHFQFGSLIAVLFIAALALNLWIPRLYCSMLCPLGALLGVFSRFALFRLEREPSLCKECDVCSMDCQGAAAPQGPLKVSECMLCMNCTQSCHRDGIRYRFITSSTLTTAKLDLNRRHLLGSLAAGVAAIPLARTSDGVGPRPDPRRIRPPGAREEQAFLERCIKCGACMKICPTGGLQPAFAEAGLEGLWTPVLVPRLGHCEQTCTLCGQVCPTGAIAQITLRDRVIRPPQGEPVRIGLAFFDRGRCLPWAMETPCIVCEEVCPTSPKAIRFRVETITKWDGTTVDLKRPYVDPDLCVGCGACEARCPVFDKAAIRVSSVGESRSPRNRIMLTGGKV